MVPIDPSPRFLWLCATASVAILLAVPGSLAGAASPIAFTPPYSGFSTHGHHANTIIGCPSIATANRLQKPWFNKTFGRAILGSAVSTGCGSTSSNTQAVGKDLVRLVGFGFSVVSNRSYWINVTWNLTFTLTERDLCPSGCNNSNFGASSYGIWINCSLIDTTTHLQTPILYRNAAQGYINGTMSGSPNIRLTYRNVSVPFYAKISLVTTDTYEFKMVVRDIVAASAMGLTGRAFTSLNLATKGNGAWLQQISVT